MEVPLKVVFWPEWPCSATPAFLFSMWLFCQKGGDTRLGWTDYAV
jgi:hypothetical protein